MRLFLIFFLASFLQAQQPAVEKIMLLKEQQVTASTTDFQQLETNIEDLYKQENAVYRKSSFYWFFVIMHALPSIVWQLIFLCLWWFFMLRWQWLARHKISTLFISLLLITSGFFVTLSYYEQQTNYFVIPNHTSVMRLGPGQQYAERIKLPYLSMVLIKKQQKDWLLGDYQGTRGWISMPGITA